MRSMAMSAERIRREKWVDGKTQEIKTMTVRGLEPEIQRLLAQHQSELEEVRAAHAENIQVESRFHYYYYYSLTFYLFA